MVHDLMKFCTTQHTLTGRQRWRRRRAWGALLGHSKFSWRCRHERGRARERARACVRACVRARSRARARTRERQCARARDFLRVTCTGYRYTGKAQQVLKTMASKAYHTWFAVALGSVCTCMCERGRGGKGGRVCPCLRARERIE